MSLIFITPTSLSSIPKSIQIDRTLFEMVRAKGFAFSYFYDLDSGQGQMTSIKMKSTTAAITIPSLD